mgnify:CR=1 FL=1
MKLYTADQVHAAYVAWFVDKRSRYKGNIKSLVSDLYEDCDDEYKQGIFGTYEEGKKLLDEAKLIMTRRGVVVHDRPKVDSPLIAVYAGYIAMSESYRLVGLKKK